MGQGIARSSRNFDRRRTVGIPPRSVLVVRNESYDGWGRPSAFITYECRGDVNQLRRRMAVRKELRLWNAPFSGICPHRIS